MLETKIHEVFSPNQKVYKSEITVSTIIPRLPQISNHSNLLGSIVEGTVERSVVSPGTPLHEGSGSPAVFSLVLSFMKCNVEHAILI